MVTGDEAAGGAARRGHGGALLGKVSGARRAGGRPCQILVRLWEERGKEETTARERIQSESPGASEPWLIGASCRPLLL